MVTLITLSLVSTLLLLGWNPGHEHTSDQPPDESDLADTAGYNWAAPKIHRPDPRTLAVGVTHTQNSIDDWGDPAASASARAVLTASATYQNQHIYGWGAGNPEPSPGTFDWSSLDRRMKLIRSTNGTPVITLCCAPDWMKGGRPGETDWDRLQVAPQPKHYADFAALAAAVARRYPDVRHFQVWNELKGFWDEARNRWDYEAYTKLYNAVYDALKAVNPAIAVGGPYVVLDLWANPKAGGYPSVLAGACGTIDQRSLDVLDYWLRYKHGADFIAVDAGSATRDGGRITATGVNSALFGALTQWLRQRTPLPVWWSEFHVGQATADGQAKLVARAVGALLHMVDQKAAVALIWQPQRDADQREADSPALWSATDRQDGGHPLAYAEAVARLQQVLADPARDEAVTWPVPELGLLRGRSALLLVHLGTSRIEVTVQGRSLPLEPYEVRYIPLRTDRPADFALAVQPAPAAAPADPCLALPAATTRASESTR
ncbi:GH39 family glycosyl hydrolase [Dactylosporangium sp. CA-139066]|uniref:GH39 family glycosyl hydrolase n=1 Tax=Dactylosporangium sp. CA-139066 TaxID=3239930 RepID=UPI003D8B1DCE